MSTYQYRWLLSLLVLLWPFGTANAQRTDGPEKFEFVASTGLDGSRTALKLPEGWVFCARVDDKGLKARPNRRNATITGVETKKEWTVSVGLTNKCGLAAKDGGARDIALVLLGPVVATDDIESIAFEWDPSAPRKLVIRVESAALANSTQIRNQTSLALPAFPSETGAWQEPCNATTCMWTIDSTDVDWRHHTSFRIDLQPNDLSWLAPDRTVYDIADGEQFQRSKLRRTKPYANWHVAGDDAEFLIPLAEVQIQAGTADHAFASPIGRLLAPGSIGCDGQGQCARVLRPTDDFEFGRLRIFLTDDVRTKIREPGGLSVTVEPKPEHKIGPGRLSVRVVDNDCRYSISQVSRIISGLNGGEVLFQVEARSQPLQRCPVTGWKFVSKNETALKLGDTTRSKLVGNRALIRVPIESTGDATTVVNAQLEPQYPDGNEVSVVAPVRAKLEPTPRFGDYSLTLARNPATPNDELINPGEFDGFATGRWNRLEFSIPTEDQWDIELLSRQHHKLPGNPGNHRGTLTNGVLVVWGRRDGGTSLKFNATLEKPARDVLLPGNESWGDALGNDAIRLGTRLVDVTRVNKPFRLAIDLQSRTRMLCGGKEPKNIDAPANKPNVIETHRSTVALKRKVFADCYVWIRLWDERDEVAQTEAKREEWQAGLEAKLTEKQKEVVKYRWEDGLSAPATSAQMNMRLRRVDTLENGARNAASSVIGAEAQGADDPLGLIYGSPTPKCAEGNEDTKNKRCLEDFLQRSGAQTITIGVETKLGNAAPTAGAEGPQKVVIDKHQLSDPRNDILHGYLRIPVKLVANGGRLKDYQEVHLTVAHEEAAYTTHPQSRTKSKFIGRARAMPLIGVKLGHREGIAKGMGLRGYLTATIPAPLQRWPNSGRSIDTSSAYRTVENLTVQAGVLGVIEPWNFDRNEAMWKGILSPQFNIGFLLLSVPGTTADSRIFVPSFVTGLGLRLPLASKPDATTETTTGFLLWYERSRGARGLPVNSLILGFNINLASLGS